MTGFSAEWLALREPADHKARNGEVLLATSRLFAHRDSIRVLDLGSGSGSNLRGMAAHLPRHQSWRLVDYDPNLIDAARTALVAWANEAPPRGDGLSLRRDDRLIDVGFQCADLSANLDDVLGETADLVTAAAFFDLVSGDWIKRFVGAIATRRLPLYAVLIYNGEERWEPPHPADPAVNAAFNFHQTTDKGFGPAAGPAAVDILATELKKNGHEVILGASPWRLTEADMPLMRPLAEGIAEAARQTGIVPPPELQAWRESRSAPDSCTIGHVDLLATPPV